MKRLLSTFCFLTISTFIFAQTRTVQLTLLETSDIHGNYLPYDFISGQDGSGSMARIASYVRSLRKAEGNKHVVLLDNGDILQGQPTAYYYNFIDTISTHLCAAALNYLHYDAATIGNHDIETGHNVYDRWISQCNFPMLGANIIRTSTNEPYLKPYIILEREGIKIAVLGMITPGIPMWLPQNLWSGLHFEDMVECTKRYMPEMKQKADIIVGLFHSGVGHYDENGQSAENATIQVARQVPGFDVIFCGHDHRRANEKIANIKGDSVVILNPAANAQAVAQANISLVIKDGKISDKSIKGSIVDITEQKPDADFTQHFAAECDTVKTFTNRIIGYCKNTMTTEPAFFGSSAFIDLLHQMQLSISGADISFVAPLAFDATIPAGEIRVRDMFNLYRYENMLYVMELTGQEIKDYLEYSYNGWTNQMKSPEDHLLRFRSNAETIEEPWQRLQTANYNYDSAAGILYTVDVTKPFGQKINIESLANGKNFDLHATYRCAINSYRGNGGGGLLTQGAGIKEDELTQRIVWSTDKDLRYYLLTAISKEGTISPTPLNQWRFVPESWVEEAKKRDVKLLRK